MYYDPMYYYAWGALTSTIGGRAQSKRDDLASAVKAVEKRMQKSIDRQLSKKSELILGFLFSKYPLCIKRF